MLKKILVVAVVVILAFVTFVACQPSEFHIRRSARMSAPASAVFAEINDFHQWAAWSPWEKLDPAMKKTFEGAPQGVGAIYSWSGNREAGKGRMEIVQSKPADLVRIKLNFLEPFKATDDTEFALKPEANQTVVTWTMSGKNPFLMKAMGLFVNMDKMIGGDFEKGLAQMKAVVEAPPK